MPFFRIFFSLLLIILASVSYAQLPNQAFYKKDDKVDLNYTRERPSMGYDSTTNSRYIICYDARMPDWGYPAGNLELGIRSLGFFKDNEYFNKIADGYTLFGYQLQPSLKYYPSEKIKLEAGAMLLKDFGNRKYRLIQPTFTATYSTGKHTFLFGTLTGNLNFNYIEPLWDFERQLTTPIQNGIQYIYQGNRFDFQMWADWQVMQYAYDTKQEEIAGGFTGNLKGFHFKHTQISFPVQFTAKHKGGQIDVVERPLTTLFNGAAGFEITNYLGNWNDSLQQGSFLRSIYTKNYFVGYKDHSFTHQLPFQGGSGIYLNAGADTRWVNLMLSYWRGNGYISEFGGRLYQSVSTTVKNPGYTERNRQLLMLRIMKDWHIVNEQEYTGLTFTGRLEPFYDFKTGSVEFAAGLYLNFNTDFFLGKPKLRSR